MDDLNILHCVQRMKATAELRKALQTKLEEMIRNEEPVKEVNHMIIIQCKSYEKIQTAVTETCFVNIEYFPNLGLLVIHMVTHSKW